MTHSSSPHASGAERFYVVAPDRGRRPGIYDDWERTKAQTDGYPNGQPKRFASLARALAYWAEVAPDTEPDLYLTGEPSERGTLLYLGRDGEYLQGEVEGEVAERVVRFLLGLAPPRPPQ